VMCQKSNQNKKTIRSSFKLPKFRWWGWLLLGCAAIAIYCLPARLIRTTTVSLDTIVFWKTTLTPDKFVADAYLAYEHAAPSWHKDKEGQLFLKRVGCVPGETIKRTEAFDFYCNDRYLGRAITKDSKGNPLEITSFEGVLPEGKYFMVGDIAKSWDSKYYGPIDQSKFRVAAIPLF